MRLILFIGWSLMLFTEEMCKKWPDPKVDKMTYISNPIESGLPGHWVPLSVLKYVLKGGTPAKIATPGRIQKLYLTKNLNKFKRPRHVKSESVPTLKALSTHKIHQQKTRLALSNATQSSNHQKTNVPFSGDTRTTSLLSPIKLTTFNETIRSSWSPFIKDETLITTLPTIVTTVSPDIETKAKEISEEYDKMTVKTNLPISSFNKKSIATPAIKITMNSSKVEEDTTPEDFSTTHTNYNNITKLTASIEPNLLNIKVTAKPVTVQETTTIKTINLKTESMDSTLNARSKTTLSTTKKPSTTLKTTIMSSSFQSGMTLSANTQLQTIPVLSTLQITSTFMLPTSKTSLPLKLSTISLADNGKSKVSISQTSNTHLPLELVTTSLVNNAINKMSISHPSNISLPLESITTAMVENATRKMTISQESNTFFPFTTSMAETATSKVSISQASSTSLSLESTKTAMVETSTSKESISQTSKISLPFESSTLEHNTITRTSMSKHIPTLSVLQTTPTRIQNKMTTTTQSVKMIRQIHRTTATPLRTTTRQTVSIQTEPGDPFY